MCVKSILPQRSGCYRCKRHWEDSATVLSMTLSGSAIVPARLTVIGEDRVRVPAGTFDCWVVAVHGDPARGLYWSRSVMPKLSAVHSTSRRSGAHNW